MRRRELRGVVAIPLAMRTPVVFLLLGLTAFTAGCASLGTHPPHTTDLSGDWKLDQSLSDDPHSIMRQQRQHGSGQGMGHHGGMGGGGMGGGGMGGYGQPQQITPGAATTGTPGGSGTHHGHGGGYGGGWSGGRHNPDNQFMAQPDALSIQQSGDSLKMVADGVPTDFVYGEKVAVSVQGGSAERISGWKGQDFVVKFDVSEGPKATRSYELNDGGKQLVVTTQLEGGHGADIKFRTVYARQSK